jgi:hypothetical protein
MSSKKQSLTQESLKKPFGIRETPITLKVKPVGHVAFCHTCEWSTGIFVTGTDGDSYSLANRRLLGHLKTEDHRRRREHDIRQ